MATKPSRLIDGLLDRVERVVFGASAQERVDMMTELAAQRVIERLTAAWATDDTDDTEQHDAGE